MSRDTTLETIAVMEAALNLAVAAGLNYQKLVAMRDANGGNPLTAEQRLQLSEDAQEAIDQL